RQIRPRLEQLHVVRLFQEREGDVLERLADNVAETLAIELYARRLGFLQQRAGPLQVDLRRGERGAYVTIQDELGGHSEHARQRQVLRDQEPHERRVLLVQPSVCPFRIRDA